jgi:hypothetical protein
MKGLKTGGRQKGTPNKESAFVGLLLEKRGFNLVNEAMNIYSEGDNETKLKILNLLFPYVYPKRVDAPPDDALDITPENELSVATETLQAIYQKFPQLNPGKDE